MSIEACCTCATLLSDTKVPYDPSSEKPLALDRRLDCCDRVICALCISKNPRFANYCPYCQISSTPSALPSQGLREPPAYSPPRSPQPHGNHEHHPDTSSSDPPAYSEIPHSSSSSPAGTDLASQDDVVHHLHPTRDTLPSISLLYRVPLPILRRHNALYSDHLLSARKVLLIPASHYQGPSLSAEPVDSPEEVERKNKIRRFMVAAKCPEYDVAVLYLQNYGFELDLAVEAFREDERWEKEHPMEGSANMQMGKGKGKGKAAESKKKGQGWRRLGIGAGVTGQLS